MRRNGRRGVLKTHVRFLAGLVCCVGFIACCPVWDGAVAQGSTFFVKTTGNDSNNGLSRSSAWRTIQHAADKALPGDNIIVLSGSYPGARIERSGTAPAPITLRADTGAAVKLNAPGLANRHSSIIEVETWAGSGIVSYWNIQGFEIAGSPRYGVDLRNTRHITVRKSHVHNSALTGIFTAFSDYALIDGNETDHNGEHGIYHSNSGDHPTIRRNVSHHNNSCGIHMNGDASMGGDGIISYGLVDANIIYENGAAGGSGINMDGVTHSVISNNLLYANHASGISMYQIDGGACSNSNRVLNNTILVAVDGRWAINIPDSGCTGNQVFNNILYNYHPWHGCILIAPENLAGFASDYNVVMNRFSADGNDGVIGLSAWQALGQDAHSFIAAPQQLFAGTTAHDFHLKVGSPAIDTGTTVVGAARDLEGIPRPQGNGPDRGAYEYDLPWVSIAATDSLALASGGNPGSFTVYRTGGIQNSLTVLYSLSGTAINGTDYVTLSGKVTIPVNASSAVITVTPVPGHVITEPKTVVVTVKRTINNKLGSPTQAVVNIRP